jgi:AcrR family transcriptional regulator
MIKIYRDQERLDVVKKQQKMKKQKRGRHMEKTQRKVQSRTIESRKKLLSSAYQLFAQKGYYHTNTKEIAKAAGVSVGNFYNYFKDKSDIYCELAIQYIDGSVVAVKGVFDQIGEEENDIAAMADMLAGYVDKQMARAVESDRFFSDSQVLVRDIPRLMEKEQQSSEQIQYIIKDFLVNHPQIRKRASYEVMSRMLYSLANDISQNVIITQGMEIYQEYLDEMIFILVYYMLGIEWKRKK